MPIRHKIWTVESQPTELSEAELPSEALLESMIRAAPSILSDDWMLIGCQEDTGFGGRIDLLAVAPDGALVLIELKRSRTPREVVAQALDYATWVDALETDDIARIYNRFKPGGDLAGDFAARFGQPLDEQTLNQRHEIVIAASALDPGTERIVAYLAARGIAINALFFQIFQNGEQQIISRAWLIDPAETQVTAAVKSKGEREPWNGEFYANFGVSENRSWAEARRYGFISAGGGAWYTGPLTLLKPGDRVWVNAPPGNGYVGVGIVEGPAQPFSAFTIKTPEGEKPAADVLSEANYFRDESDPDKFEYFVPMRWLDTVPLDRGLREVGLFGITNTVARPTAPKWRHTVERLKTQFPNYNKSS